MSGHVVQAPARVENAIVHHSVPSIADWVRSMNAYTSLEADRLLREDRSASVLRLLGMPLFRSAELYIGRRGYRSGRYGLAVALLSFCYWLIAELKLWEKRLEPGSLPADAISEPSSAPACEARSPATPPIRPDR